MLKAFDTFLQSIVSADLAAQNSADEPYRYECACCGEEVIIAAKHSDNMIAHFRHRNGNNDVDCEKYLGSGLLNASTNQRRSDREKAEFYFNNMTKCFYIGLRFNKSELLDYGSKDVDIEIRTHKNGTPFFSQRINDENFSADFTKKIMLETFSPNYFISNSFNNVRRAYTIFREGVPSFFKIQGKEEYFNAKLVRSETLFTGVRYFVALVNSNSAQLKLKKTPGVKIEYEYDFMSMKNHVWASIISFEFKTVEIESLLYKWNYSIDTPEILTLLWPPSHIVDETNYISSDKAFLYTSFRVQACGNINTDDEKIKCIAPNITAIEIDKHIKVLKKNAEIEMEILELEQEPIKCIVDEYCAGKYRVPNENSHYLFSKTGVRELKFGEEIILHQNAYVCVYSNGHLVKIVRPVAFTKMSGEELFIDLLKHYKVQESLDDIQLNIKSSFLTNYINDCKKAGTINSMVKRYIKEGRL